MDSHKDQYSGFDVVLVYPRKRVTYSKAMLPLGILSIAAVLEHAGFRVKVLDMNIYKGGFSEDLVRWNPKIIGFGGTTPTRKAVYSLARIAKTFLPDAIVVFGGPHAAFTAVETLTGIPEIDFTVAGEGEYPMLSLCRHFIRTENLLLESIAGLGFRTSKGIVQNMPERIDDLGQLPLPARHLLDYDYPLKLDFFNVDAAFIMTSRGCPVQCTFCSASTMYKGGVRLRSMDNIRDELSEITSDKLIKGLKIFDSTFTSERKHVEEFCDMVESFDLIWECEVRADTVDYELLAKMKHAGCKYIDLGLESSNPKYLSRLNKGITVEQVLKVIDWCNDLDIYVKLFIIFGHMDQTFKECLSEISFMKGLRRKVALFDVSMGMRIFPGTQLEIIARKRGFLREDFSWINFQPSWRRLMIGDLTDAMTLEQKQLNYFHLALLAIILHARGLILTRRIYMRIFAQYFRSFLDKINIFRKP